MKYTFTIPITAILCLLFHLPQLQAEAPPDTLWARTFGDTNIDIGHELKQTGDGGFIITGYTRSYGITSGRNVWLVKTDSDGNLQWHNTYGGNNDDEGHAVQQTSDGGYIIAGHTKSLGAGGTDVLLIKTDADGSQEWIRTFGGTLDGEGYSVLQTADGGYVVAGVTTSFAVGGRDMWLIKTDPVGNIVWSETYGGLSSDGAWSVVQTTDGGFALAGWTFTHGPGPLGNAWLVKTDATGNQLWHRAFGGSSVDRAHDLKQLHDGGYVITGYTASSGAGLDDMLLIRTDASGNEIWNRTYGGSGRDYGQSVIQTVDQESLIMAGYTLSYGMGSEDMWLVKTDMDGELIWQLTLGGSSADVGNAIEQTTDGDLIVAGYTLSFGAGVHDLWLVRFSSDITALPDNIVTKSYQHLKPPYPNPANTSVTIPFEVKHQSKVRIQLFDSNGRPIITLLDDILLPGDHYVSLEQNELAAGVYQLRLESNNVVEIRRIVLLQ